MIGMRVWLAFALLSLIWGSSFLFIRVAVELASAFYALSAVLTRRTLRHVGSMTIATYALWFSCAQSMILSLIFSPPPVTSLDGSTVFATAWLGILGSAVAYIFYYFIIQ